MASLGRPFSAFVKEHRPLQAKLAEYTEPLAARLRSVTSLSELEVFEREVADFLLAPRPFVKLGGLRTESKRTQEWAATSDGRRVMATRHYVELQVHGDFLLCCTWPDDSTDLTAADDDTSWPESGLATIDARADVWTLGSVATPTEPKDWNLHTYFDLTPQDEARVANGEVNLTELVNERVDRVRPVIERLDRQVEDFFTSTLPESLANATAKLREELTNREAVTESFWFPDEWVVEPLRLEGAPEEPGPALAESVPDEVQIPQIPRLERASFERLQSTIRLWADAVERHPRAFRDMPEDHLSDLLAATLNATFAGANREVFSHSGKTDIYVRADVFGEGRGPAKIFVAESKKATSRPVVQGAVREQLFKYLTTSDLSAVLLLFFPQESYLDIRSDYLTAIKEVEGYVDAQLSAVEGWPLLRFQHKGRLLSVCVAMVHVH